MGRPSGRWGKGIREVRGQVALTYLMHCKIREQDGGLS